jgi:hypothetical protein
VKAPIDLASHFHWNGDVFTDRQIIDTVTPRHAKHVVNDPAHRAEPVWDPKEHPQAWRARWAYSAKRARRDQKTLYAQEARARAVISGERAAKSTRFVKTHAGDRVLDEASLDRAQSLVGLKGYVTNIPAAVMGRTTSTCSCLLYDTLGVVYDWLGFDVVDDPVFRDLVIARLVEPTSKADAARVLTDLGADTVSYKTIQRHLAKINTHNYRDAIAAQCFSHASDRGGLSLLLYDVTT